MGMIVSGSVAVEAQNYLFKEGNTRTRPTKSNKFEQITARTVSEFFFPQSNQGLERNIRPDSQLLPQACVKRGQHL